MEVRPDYDAVPFARSVDSAVGVSALSRDALHAGVLDPRLFYKEG